MVFCTLYLDTGISRRKIAAPRPRGSTDDFKAPTSVSNSDACQVPLCRVVPRGCMCIPCLEGPSTQHLRPLVPDTI